MLMVMLVANAGTTRGERDPSPLGGGYGSPPPLTRQATLPLPPHPPTPVPPAQGLAGIFHRTWDTISSNVHIQVDLKWQHDADHTTNFAREISQQYDLHIYALPPTPHTHPTHPSGICAGAAPYVLGNVRGNCTACRVGQRVNGQALQAAHILVCGSSPWKGQKINPKHGDAGSSNVRALFSQMGKHLAGMHHGQGRNKVSGTNNGSPPPLRGNLPHTQPRPWRQALYRASHRTTSHKGWQNKPSKRQHRSQKRGVKYTVTAYGTQCRSLAERTPAATVMAGKPLWREECKFKTQSTATQVFGTQRFSATSRNNERRCSRH